ncbi:MAG: hypothetical protein ABFS42_05045 [Candidatus Krumholzibacteriota bacterium]
MNRMITPTLILAILSLPVLLSAAPIPVNLGVPFALGPGQSAEVLGETLYFVFTGILSDSRCPQGAICAWEGDAEAAVVGDLPGEIQINCVLHTAAMFSQSCDMGPYRVTLLWVEPFPILGEPPINPADYIAHLVIVESGSVDVEYKAWGTIKALYR